MSPIQQSRSMGLTGMLRRRRSAGHITNPNANTNATNHPTSASQPASPSVLVPTGPPSVLATAPPIPSPPTGVVLVPNSTHSHPPPPPSLLPVHPPPIPHPSPTNPSPNPNPNTPHRIRLVPHLESRRSLKFEAISRDIREGDPPLRIGRFTDRSGLGLSAVNALGTNKLAFKSKVVSRSHAEISLAGGQFFIKDTKSSSGTFLNHSRLSPAGTESGKVLVRDGDVLQLGVDYQGGTEDVYKSVKIRVEIGREWQGRVNAFNTTAMRNLKQLAVGIAPQTKGEKKATTTTPLPDCCICLFTLTIHQALFIAPCSHTFHYKCIRPLLESHHPGFSCPLCRTFADLEEDVEVEGVGDIWAVEGADLGEGEEAEADEDEGEDEEDRNPTPISIHAHPSTRDTGVETEVETEPIGGGGGRRVGRVNEEAEGVLSADEGEDEEGEGMLIDPPPHSPPHPEELLAFELEGAEEREGEDDHLHPDELELGLAIPGMGMVVDGEATVGSGGGGGGKRKR